MFCCTFAQSPVSVCLMSGKCREMAGRQTCTCIIINTPSRVLFMYMCVCCLCVYPPVLVWHSFHLIRPVFVYATPVVFSGVRLRATGLAMNKPVVLPCWRFGPCAYPTFGLDANGAPRSLPPLQHHPSPPRTTFACTLSPPSTRCCMTLCASASVVGLWGVTGVCVGCGCATMFAAKACADCCGCFEALAACLVFLCVSSVMSAFVRVCLARRRHAFCLFVIVVFDV